jgi:hypothetical protein
MSVERFRPGIEKALALAGTHDMDDLLRRILSGKAKLWVEDEAFIVTEIHEYPLQKVLRFWIATGDLDDCMKLRGKIEKWGKEQGCTLAMTYARRGWTKPLRVEGWTDKMAVLTKEL